MVGAVGEIGGVLGFQTIGGTGDEHTDAGHGAGGEGAADVVGGLVDKGRKLVLLSSVEQEKPETVVRVHDLDFTYVIISPMPNP